MRHFGGDDLSRDLVFLLLLENDIEWAHLASSIIRRVSRLAGVARVTRLSTVLLEHGRLNLGPGRHDTLQLVWELVEALRCHFTFSVLLRIFATSDTEWVNIGLLVCPIGKITCDIEQIL